MKIDMRNKGGQARIGISAHLISTRVGYQRAGIHRYISQLIKHLPVSDDHQLTVFTNGDTVREDNHFIQVTPSRWPTEKRTVRILWEQLALPVLAQRLGLDLLHGMAFVLPLVSPCPAVVTVYDLSFIYYPNRYPTLQRIYLTSQTRRSCQTAKRVVVISESTGKDLTLHYGINEEKIDVVRPGVGETFAPMKQDSVDSFREKRGLPEQFLLHVGTLQPRKNIPLLLEALASLGRKDLKLILVGGEGWQYESIYSAVEDNGLEGQVEFRGYVPDDELPFYYNAAAATVFPSLYEGFGLPVVEAMACGSPVIAARSSSIPEAAGDAALLFEPDDNTALANHIETIVDDPLVAATMSENGIVQASQFTWQLAGEQMMAVYDQVLREG